MYKEHIDKIRKILQVGVPLQKYGTNSWGLTKDQALKILELFHSEKIPILGGDVYALKGDLILPNYDNWSCNPIKGETEETYLERSIMKAKDYIGKYPIKSGELIYFVLVPR